MKLLIISFLSIMAGVVNASTMIVVFSGTKYAFPAEPNAVIFSNDSSMIINYKNDIRDGYISISNELDFDTGTCSNVEFFDQALRNTNEPLCGLKETKSFRFVFMKNALVDSWKSGASYYLFLKDERSHVFKVTESSIVLFSSSILTKEGWYKVLQSASSQ